MSQAREHFYPDRFKPAARYYTTGRPSYPPLLSQRIAELIGLDQDSEVLDIGAGPGFLAIDFAAHARQVTALDPSPEMLATAEQNARAAGVEIRFVRGSSYELGPQLGRFRLASFGRSFHWTDREATLRALDALIEPGGAVALIGDRFPDLPENAWRKTFTAVLDRYGAGDPARPELRSPVAHESVLLASPFDHLERIAVLQRRRTPLERFVDRALSFGKVWHGSTELQPDNLAADIRAALAPHADGEGLIEELIEGHALVARRTREVPGA